jgi:hypothetical protein
VALTRQASTYFLHPHNIERGRRCRGWMIGKESLVHETTDPSSPSDAVHQAGGE